MAVKGKPVRDLTGQQFGDLTVISYIPGKGWLCQCRCGNTSIVDTRNLTSHHTESCGCWRYRLGRNLKDLTGYENEYLKVVSRDLTTLKPVTWNCICKSCLKPFKAKNTNIYRVKSCGCKTSVNNELIDKLLKEAKVEYAREYTFKDLVYKNVNNPLRFDFAVFKDHKLSHLIEYNGKQHYEKPIGSWGNCWEELQERDKLKLQYCKDHNIELRIIKYDQDYTIDDLI